jgi:uncharacterized protein with FMN-binding domain
MKRIALTAFSTLAVLVLLFLYPTSTGNSGTTAAEAVSAARVVTSGGTTATTTGQGPDPATAGSAGTGSTTGSSPARGATAGPSATPGAASRPAITVDGASEMTSYGVVQVRVVIANGAITDVTAVQYPQSEREDIRINSKAVPMLRAQVLAAQSAKIDGVSGATFTTDGYVTSLQSALDAAGFTG